MSIWPFFLINEFGIGIAVLIVLNFWIGMFVGENAWR